MQYAFLLHVLKLNVKIMPLKNINKKEQKFKFDIWGLTQYKYDENHWCDGGMLNKPLMLVFIFINLQLY